MTRLVLAIVAAMALTGCQHSGQAVQPLLGPDEGAASANRFDWRPNRHSGISATLAAANERDARSAAVQQRAPAGQSRGRRRYPRHGSGGNAN